MKYGLLGAAFWLALAGMSLPLSAQAGGGHEVDVGVRIGIRARGCERGCERSGCRHRHRCERGCRHSRRGGFRLALGFGVRGGGGCGGGGCGGGGGFSFGLGISAGGGAMF